MLYLEGHIIIGNKKEGFRAKINMEKMRTFEIMRYFFPVPSCLPLHGLPMDLPWCDFLFCMPCDSPEMTYKMVLSQKEQFSLTELAKQTEFSDEFQDLCKLIDNLSFEDYPNYQRITKILSGIVEMRFPDQPENRVFQWKRQL